MGKIIPQIKLEIFEDIYIDNILDLYRITKEELEEKISGSSSFSLNKRAERYIETYLMNRAKDFLIEDNWLACKELYIQWKLLEEIELEEVSKDKKESLIEILELFKDRIIREESNGSTVKKSVGIMVFGG